MKKIDLWTIQIAKWRKVPEDIAFLDTTVKSGNMLLAPRWMMVIGLKSGELSEEDYRKAYYKLMEGRLKSLKEPLRKLFIETCEGKKGIALACYCAAGCFCHRLLLAKEILPLFSEDLGIEFNYKGEVK